VETFGRDSGRLRAATAPSGEGLSPYRDPQQVSGRQRIMRARMQYMASRLGAWQVGDDLTQGAVEFNVFFPSGADPHIAELQVTGSFQSQLGGTDWDFTSAPQLTQHAHAEGSMWTYTTPKALPAGFYEYKYFVTFQNGERRWVSDPCTRYGGSNNQNAAIAVGGSWPDVRPLKNGRKPMRDLIVYELHLDDFTADFRDTRAPMDAATDKLDYLQGLGVNAVLFMPWTTWQNPSFDWGYTPFQYFAAEFRYVNDSTQPEEKLSALRNLINACHDRDIHVIMDGVFNHVHADFPYQYLYQSPSDCPFTAQSFGGTFTGLQDLDFYNTCTQELVRDVCTYWIGTFGIDGIRFDNTVNYNVPGDSRGIPDLLDDIRAYVDQHGGGNFSLTLEHLSMDAVSLVNSTRATSYWDNSLYQKCFDALWNESLDASILDTLDNQRWLTDPNKAPTLYLSNHDHSHVAWQAGARDNQGGFEWYRTQPFAIALFTAPGTPMVHSGNEFAEDHWIPENDENTGRRVRPRPLRWPPATDAVAASTLRLYRRLGAIRQQYPGLRSTNFYPNGWSGTALDPDGFGVDTARQVMLFHRWGTSDTGRLQRFYVVLNFSDQPQSVSVPFPENGPWTDLLANFDGTWTPSVSNFQLDLEVSSHWGHVFFRED
jgi:pullulanase